MIAIFRRDILAAGGIETWLYYLAKKYSKSYHIVVYYKNIEQRQLLRLSRYVRCIKYTEQDIDCDTAIFCYDFLGLKKTKAKKYIHVVHADYAEINLAPNIPENIDEIYGVSEIACNSFTKETGRECKLLYNPVYVDTPKPILKLISATRLTEEKGLWRIRELARALDSAGVVYQWDIFTPQPAQVNSPNVVFRDTRLDITNFIAASDYLVQLSDTESYCYSLVEALELGVPVISTKLPVLKELGITSKHGIIIGLKEKNYDMYVSKIIKKVKAFVYHAPKDAYTKVFGPEEKVDYTPDTFLVRNIGKKVYFVQEGITAATGDTFIVNGKARLDSLVDGGYVEVVE